MSRAQPRILDLFAGAGLFSQAFQEEGGNVVAAYELDRHAAASYANNVGKHVDVRDVRRVDESVRADVVVAGPPCQGFSTLGTRDPADVRNRLCLAVATWAKSAHASVVVVENVPPFLESKPWRSMRDAFDRLGYEVGAWCLDAAHYGVPQRRRRSFTIASRIGLPQLPSPRRQQNAAVAFGRVRRDDPMHIWPEHSPLAQARMDLLPSHGDRRDLLAAAPALCPPSWHKIGCQATDVWGRIDSDQPANTLRTDFQNPSKGRYVHPTENRMISLREGARLQQIPERWEMSGHRTAVTRQIGNGVPLGLGRAVASEVLALF